MSNVVPVFAATVTSDGMTLAPNQAKSRRNWLRSLFARGILDIEVIYRARKSQRSLDQNKYWWAVPVALVAEHTGFTKEQAHMALLGEYGGYDDATAFKQPIQRITSSSKMSTADFTKLIEWVLEWGPSELGVFIPGPNEAE